MSLLVSSRRSPVTATERLKHIKLNCPHRFVYVGPWLTLWIVVTALLGSKASITTLIIMIALSFVPPGNVSVLHSSRVINTSHKSGTRLLLSLCSLPQPCQQFRAVCSNEQHVVCVPHRCGGPIGPLGCGTYGESISGVPADVLGCVCQPE